MPSVPPVKVPEPYSPPKQLRVDDVCTGVNGLLKDLYRTESGDSIPDYELQEILRILATATAESMHRFAVFTAEADVRRRKRLLTEQKTKLSDAEKSLAELKAARGA